MAIADSVQDNRPRLVDDDELEEAMSTEVEAAAGDKDDLIRLQSARWGLGIALVVVVAVIWSFSSVLVQSIFKAKGFPRPFFLTYVANSLFVVLLPLRAASSAVGYAAVAASAAASARGWPGPRCLRRTRMYRRYFLRCKRRWLVLGSNCGGLCGHATPTNAPKPIDAHSADTSRQGTRSPETAYSERLSPAGLAPATLATTMLLNDAIVAAADGSASPTSTTDDTMLSADQRLQHSHRSCGNRDAGPLAKDREAARTPDVAPNNTCTVSPIVTPTVTPTVTVCSRTRWSRCAAVARPPLLVCPLWFLANYTYNLSLGMTSVTSSTVISSSSSAFTLLLSLWLLRERFTWPKLAGVALCWAGNALTAVQDGGGHASVRGDALCLLSAVMYAWYTVAIRYFSPADVSLFFGLLGLFNALLLAPIVVLLHVTGVEDLSPLTWEIMSLLTFKGLADNVLSDYLWAQAVLLTSPSTATVGLSLTIPIAMLSEVVLPDKYLIDASAPTPLALAGALLVVAGFIVINKATAAEAELPQAQSEAGVRAADAFTQDRCGGARSSEAPLLN